MLYMSEQTEMSSNARHLKVFLGGLPSHWEHDQVAQFMQSFGRVVQVQIKRDSAGYSKGFGFVYLEDHLDPKILYGKHQYGDTFIEIKELKQKHIYLSFGNASPNFSEDYIARSFHEQGFPVETIEFGGKATGGDDSIAKITFVYDSSAKHFLHKKFVDIGRISYNVFSSIDYLKPRIGSPSSKYSKGKPASQMAGEYAHSKRFRNHYNYHDPNQDEGGKKEDPKHVASKPKKLLHKPSEESHKLQQTESDTVIENEIIVKPKVSVIQTSTQSSDDQLSTGKAKASEPTRAIRKLSYKGKEIEFHPSHLSEEAPQLLVVESSPRNTDFQTEFSSSSKDQASISKLSSSSMDWKLENLVMWPQAGYNPQMLYSFYSQMPANSAFYPSSLKKTPEWMAQKDVPFEQPRKKEVRIEFFTFPGFV